MPDKIQTFMLKEEILLHSQGHFDEYECQSRTNIGMHQTLDCESVQMETLIPDQPRPSPHFRTTAGFAG